MLFLFLAGYFACRNITWRKALDNAWWSFAPFVLWNVIFIAVEMYKGNLPVGATWYTLFGFNQFFIPEWGIDSQLVGHGGLYVPLNVPLWFMRDLIFLFLLSPILCKCAKYLFPALVLASLVPGLSNYFEHDIGIRCVMSPYSLTFFVAGCAMRTLSKETQNAFLKFYSPKAMALMLCFIWGLWGVRAGVRSGHLPEYLLTLSQSLSLVRSLLAAWLLYQTARWVEVKIPVAKPIALKFAPVTFLTFAAHMLVYRHLPLNGTPLVLIYPPLVFVLLAVFFYALKRWCRPLLHLVAHYKLRPDDLEPKAASKKSKKSETVAG